MAIEIAFRVTCNESVMRHNWPRFKHIIIALVVGFQAQTAFPDLGKQEVCHDQTVNIAVDQCDALIDFYNSTNGDDWKKNQNWGTADVGSWEGVNISLTDVIWLRLDNNNLRGKIPNSFPQLKSLYNLTLSHNKLSGTLPNNIFSDISQFLKFNLNNNKLSGPLPRSLSSTQSIGTFNLSNNLFSGTLPDWIHGGAGNSLFIDLSNNRISGPIPDLPTTLSSKNHALNLNNNVLTGPIPNGIFLNYDNIYIQNNKLSGNIPDTFGQFTGHDVNISDNEIVGSIPGLSNEFSPRGDLNFSENNLTGDISELIHNLDSFNEVNLSHNKFSGSLPLLNISLIFSLDLSHNNFDGEIINLNVQGINDLDLSFNNFIGNIPIINGPQGQDHFFTTLNLSNNQFSGEIPQHYLIAKPRMLDLSGNRLHGDLETFKNKFEEKSRDRIDITRQNPYQFANDSRGLIDILFLDPTKTSIFLIDIPKGKRVTLIDGCNGNLSGSIFRLSKNQPACDINVKVENCDSDSSCLIDSGATNGIRNGKIEYPASNSIISGVIQFRGWIHEPVIRRYKSYSILNPRRAKLFIDDVEVNIDINFDRFDVSSAMGYNENNQLPIGWSALFYAGNLSNGDHKATLMTHEGAIIDTLIFNSVTLLDDVGKPSYISGNERDLNVIDFPYQGSEVLLRFSSSEQNFSIIDQFDLSGIPSRSSADHFSPDDLQPQNFGSISGVDRVNIETPTNQGPLLGVASMRGWAYGNALLDGPLYIGLDDGPPALLPRGKRADVENAMGIITSNRIGWSQLIYAGNLDNGHHRLRLYGEQDNRKVLLAQNFFESFVPLDQNKKPVYIKKDKIISINDFPFKGSLVTLQFNSSGQNFSVVDQKTTTK